MFWVTVIISFFIMIYSVGDYRCIFHYTVIIPCCKEICISLLNIWLDGIKLGYSMSKTALYSFGTDSNFNLYSFEYFNICVIQPKHTSFSIYSIIKILNRAVPNNFYIFFWLCLTNAEFGQKNVWWNHRLYLWFYLHINNNKLNANP